MFKAFYNLGLLLLLIVALPRLLQKKYRTTLLARWGSALPLLEKKEVPVVWIHAVSVGEVKAVVPFFQQLLERYPSYRVVISTTTATGQAEARKSIPQAAAHFLLPFDLSWVITKAVRAYRPKLLVLVESDFWYNLVDAVKKQGGNVVLINGKISPRSTKRFRQLPYFAKKLFDNIDHFALQTVEYQSRFLSIGVSPERCEVTGNIKLDTPSIRMSLAERCGLRAAWGLDPEESIITLGSTHPGEEVQLLEALKPVWEAIPSLRVLLVPRHPERFKSVADALKVAGFPFAQLTRLDRSQERQRVVLIDAMGLLTQCYALSQAAIVGGSFVDNVGGHNILEPVASAIPVLFGPYMEAQGELVDLVVGGKVGFQVTAASLSKVLIQLLQNPSLQGEIAHLAAALISSIRGNTQRTLDSVEKYLKIDCP